jgi:hypothetical protein
MANKYSFGSLILVLGLLLTFFGNKFLFFTEIMTGVIITLFVTLYFIMSQLTFSLQIWQFWLVIGLCCAFGALGGYFISRVEWLAAVLLSSVVGYIGGQFLYQIALKYVQTNPVAVYWCVIIACVLAGALIGYWLNKSIIIVVTAIIGAYGMIRGAAFMIGYYPDEKQIYQLINNKEWDQVNQMLSWQVYVYFVVFVILAIAGIFVQCKYFNKSDEEKKEEESKEKLMANQQLPQIQQH